MDSNRGKPQEIVGIRNSKGEFIKGHIGLRFGKRIQTICLNCNKERIILKSDIRKFCSHKCYSEHKKGTKQSESHKLAISNALKGKPKSPEHIINAANAHRGMKHPSVQGENNHNWKGDKATYGSLHDWVSGNLGNPKLCRDCGENRIDIYYQWSNISGSYRRDLSDWIRLCVRCHRKKDKNTPRASLIYKKEGKHYTTPL